MKEIINGLEIKAQPVSWKLRNAVATGLIAELNERGLPEASPRAHRQRQVMVSQTLARSLGLSFNRVDAVVKAQWTKVFGFGGSNVA